MLREPSDLIDFYDVMNVLGILAHELTELAETPQFPRKVDDHRRGRWRRSDIENYIARARSFQAQRTNPGRPAA